MENTMFKGSCQLPGKNGQLTLPHITPGYLPCIDFQMSPLLLLQVMDHRKPVARLGGSLFARTYACGSCLTCRRTGRVPRTRSSRSYSRSNTALPVSTSPASRHSTPYCRRALRNTGSRCAFACMVYLNSFVKAVVL